MKKVLSLLAVAGTLATLAAPAHAEQFVARYTYLVNGAPAIAGSPCGGVYGGGLIGAGMLSQPAVIGGYGGPCGPGLIGQPAVVARPPVVVQHREALVPHLFHLGLWPLVDFSLF